nr:translation initiation factor IF-2-like [Aegilops tauschii subsp. strangulata]
MSPAPPSLTPSLCATTVARGPRRSFPAGLPPPPQRSASLACVVPVPHLEHRCPVPYAPSVRPPASSSLPRITLVTVAANTAHPRPGRAHSIVRAPPALPCPFGHRGRAAPWPRSCASSHRPAPSRPRPFAATAAPPLYVALADAFLRPSRRQGPVGLQRPVATVASPLCATSGGRPRTTAASPRSGHGHAVATGLPCSGALPGLLAPGRAPVARTR